MLKGTYARTQWAAVSTHSSEISEPPHWANWIAFENVRSTWYGNCAAEATWPFTIPSLAPEIIYKIMNYIH